ncbi:LacI family DNA-binding transcriptional regulator [Niameybacter massiliensis]|uniref:LacI family DNA-binding transcriptional regulator n=1 Tax=Niameybacter massiliensis TaxID=1658108 RepID=UPI0006B52B6D|nr:LacI family DNA-binding transcriptional regulator [Niameybacter massiliensis]
MKGMGMSDIAEKVGVSRNTVSKVMNGRGKVSQGVRYQVIEAAIELRYHKLPQELYEEYMLTIKKDEKEKVSKNILVIATSPDFSSFWGHMISGITKELADREYSCFYNFLTFQQEKDFELPPILQEADITGIIAVNLYDKNAVNKLSQANLPTVYFDIPLGIDPMSVSADVIVVEGRRSVLKITEKLIEQGDKILGFIGDTQYCKSIEERWRGFVRAHNVAGIPIHNEYCFISKEHGHFYFEQQVEGTITSLIEDKQPLPQGFVCGNDAIAHKVIKVLRQHGYKVPEDIRISGFDDIPLEGEESTLTSVRTNIHNIGRRLAEQIVWRIDNPDRDYENIKIYGQVEFRQSTNKRS